MDLFDTITNRTLMLFDMNYLLYKSFYSHQNLSFDGKSTGGLFGFVKQFCDYIGLYSPHDVAVCIDAPPYLRKDDYHDYKASRKKLQPDVLSDMQENREAILGFLSVLGVPMWKQQGYEADDLFAWGSKKYKEDYDRIIIVSNDDDLYQILDDKVFLAKKKGSLYSKKNFLIEFGGITTEQWCHRTALSGSHNDVPGLPGIGKVKSLKIIKDKAEWDRVYLENKSIIDQYLKVIKLPYDDNIKGHKISKIKYDFLALKGFLSDHGITLFPNFKQAIIELYRKGVV